MEYWSISIQNSRSTPWMFIIVFYKLLHLQVSYGSALGFNSSNAELPIIIPQQTCDLHHRYQAHNEILASSSDDLYGGVVVELKKSMDSRVYVLQLRASMSEWRLQKKKGIWIKLPIQLANLVEPTVKEGFRYHHAEPEYLMLVHWIPDSPDTIPGYASHTVGVGAFVMNDNGMVLVIQEKDGAFKGTGVWKLPTGVVNQGEDICMAAIREVKEETGIDTVFIEVLAFSQTHQAFFGKSDLFFVCMLEAKTSEIKKQDSEIEAAQWMQIEEYVDQDYNKKHDSFKYVAEICLAKSKRKNYIGFSAVPTKSSSGKVNFLYINSQDFYRL